MLVVDEFCQLLRVGLIQSIERSSLRSQGLGQPVQKALRLIRIESPEQQLARELHAAASHMIARCRKVMELLKDRFGLFAGDSCDFGDLAADFLDLLLAEVL